MPLECVVDTNSTEAVWVSPKSLSVKLMAPVTVSSSVLSPSAMPPVCSASTICGASLSSWGCW